MLSANGKNKFEHWALDINYGQAISIAVFALCLFYSVAMPMIIPFGALFFGLRVSLDSFSFIIFSTYLRNTT